MESIKNIKSYIGNVFWSEEEKRDYLMNGDDYIGCRHGHDLLYKVNGEIKSVNIALLPEDTFINHASIAGNIDNISTYITKFPATQQYADYAFVALNQGDNIKIKVQGTDTFAFTITDKGQGQYFDFVMYHKHGASLSTCTYSVRNMGGYSHSGDQGSGTYFLHHIKSSPTNKHVVALGVTGYRRTPLSTFMKQNPSIVIVDKENKILYIVPCPLDVASVRNDTFAILATVARSGDNMVISVLDRPIGAENIDTGFTGASMHGLVQQAMDEHSDIEHMAGSNDVTEQNRTIIRKKIEGEMPADIQFIQKGTVCNVDEPCFVFGNSLHWQDNYYGDEHDTVTMSPFGTLKGPSIISLLQSYVGSMEMDEVSFLCSIDECLSVRIHLSDNWIESVVKINDVLINGCIILHCESDVDVKDTMTKLNISGVSAIAGPLATVVVCIKEHYYWYRGFPNYGIDTLPEFGDDVTDKIDFTASKAIPKVFYRDENSIVWNGNMCDLTVAKSEILTMNCENIVSNIMEIKTLFTQLQVICDSKQLNSIITEISDFLEIRIKESVATKMPMNATKMPMNATKDMTPLDKARYIASVKGETRKVQKTLKPLISHLAGLISNQKSQNMAYDLKQLKRRATISDNVDKATNMSTEEKMDLLSQYSDSVLFTKVNLTEFKNSVRAIKDGTMTFPNEKMITLDGEMQQIELGLTQELMELSKDNVKHELYSKNSIAINTSGIDVYLPFIINNAMLTCTDPSKIFWVDECNKEEWGIFRILTRSTIANSKTGKSTGMTSSDKQIGYMIINMIVTAMTKISETMTMPINFEDANAQLMRGLFGQLFTTIASGNNPLSMAWQLCMKSSNIECPKDDMWIYIAVIRLFKFTGWQEDYVINNSTKMIAKIVKNKICGNAIKKMQEQISKVKGDTQEAYIVSRNIELKHCHIVTDIIAHCIDNDLEFSDPTVIEYCRIARAMYDADVPKIINRQQATTDLSHFLHKVVKKIVLPSDIENIKKTALKTYVKRSACFADSKRGVLDAYLDGNDLAGAIKEFRNTRKEIKARFDIDAQILVQNKDAYKSNDIGKIKGDAEFRRRPWKLISDDNDHSENMRQIFGEDVFTSETPLPIKTKLKGFLEDVRGSACAIKLQQDSQVDLEAVVDMAVPFDDMQYVMNYIGVSDYHETIYNMITSALINHGDGDRCYSETIYALNAGKSAIV